MKLVKSSSSILRKFLVFNFLIFLVLGLFTFFYLKEVQPGLVKQKSEKHTVIINNTSNHIERLKINFENESIKNFLLSTRFLFQNLERVQFYKKNGELIGDSNVLDLDQTVFSRSDLIIEENIDKESSSSENLTNRESVLKKEENQNIIKLISDKTEEAIVLEIEEIITFLLRH